MTTNPAGVYQDLTHDNAELRIAIQRDARQMSVDDFAEHYGIIIRGHYRARGYRLDREGAWQLACDLWGWLRK